MDVASYFRRTIDNNASDLHLVEGSIPCIRIAGELVCLEEKPLEKDELKESIYKLMDANSIEAFEKNRDIDLGMEFFRTKFRVNIHHQGGRIGLAARLVLDVIPSPQDINLDEVLYGMTHLRDGLILFTGPAGVGKSTTLAVMLNIINQERAAHIITIEDPIEYTFHDKKSIIEQRQLGRDTHSFADALKYVLRQDPNVIMVGEIRDEATATAVLNAAKTGHLVFSTLHTSCAAETVERMIDFYPNQFHQQIAHQMASVLRAVVSQQLLPRVGGGLVCAREIMVNDNAISNLIRTLQFEQIDTFIQTSKVKGMITMNKYIDILHANGIISSDVAKNRRRSHENKTVYY